MNRTAPAALALLVGLTLAGCASDDPTAASGATSESTSAAPPSASAMTPDTSESTTSVDPTDAAVADAGAWVDRAAYEADPATFHESGDVVLFFNASWCPTCEATVQSLDDDGVPAGLTVVSVDYDNANDLRQQYGITVQHTFVQVDATGNELAKFTGAASGEAIAAQTA